MNWLGLINPMLLWGGLAVAAPIIIHLLNRRRFRRVDWAAMDFLIEADRRNRRRIRIEHLLLLLLRCLAVLLIALLVARLFISPGATGFLAGAARTERIVLLDDSPSMTAKLGQRDAFGRARQAVEDFVRSTAGQRPGDTFTLIRTSQPDQPLMQGQYFEQADRIIDRLRRVGVSDRPAEMDRALLAVDELLDEAAAAGDGVANRVVYIVTDLRRRDWQPAEGREGERPIGRLLDELADRTDAVIVVPIDDARTENLAVVEVGPTEKNVVAGVSERFEVRVRNYGPAPASNVEVTFTAGDAPPLTATIDNIAAGATASVPFTFTFREPGSVPIRATIPPDVLPADNIRRYAARVQPGVGVLVVDGDPSVEFGQSETFFLQRALDPPGDVASGYKLNVITENQLPAVDLDAYQVIVLANVYQVPPVRRDAVEAWVADGGGLLIFLGDQVDQTIYNEQLHRQGRGVLPARLVRVRGDETERDWALPGRIAPAHPISRIAAGLDNPLLQRIKVFRWWDAEADNDPNANTIVTLNDPEGSPLMIEKTIGGGRALMVTSSADGDWTAWPSDPSYVVTMLEAARYLARATAGVGNIATGQPLRHRLDVSRYQPEVQVRPPGQSEPLTVRAAAPSATEPNGAAVDAATPALLLRYDQTNAAGFYRAQLQQHDGGGLSLLFAANIDPREGDLAPMQTPQLRDQLESDRVTVADSDTVLAAGVTGGRIELWRTFAIALAVVLVLEQTLAWWFGQKRAAA